jgi:hypothetical protein
MPTGAVDVTDLIGSLQRSIDHLGVRLLTIERALGHTSNPYSTIASVTTPASSRRKSRRQRRREHATIAAATTAAPTPSALRSGLHSVPSNTSRSFLGKRALTIAIPDGVAGHVIGKGGAGLRQAHDISHAKVSVAPLSGSSDTRVCTIRGSDREIGDALVVIGKRMARRRVRKPKSKKKKQSSATPAPPSMTRTQAQASGLQTAKRSSGTAPGTPKTSTTATPSAPTPSSSTPKAPTPMSIGVAAVQTSSPSSSTQPSGSSSSPRVKSSATPSSSSGQPSSSAVASSSSGQKTSSSSKSSKSAASLLGSTTQGGNPYASATYYGGEYFRPKGAPPQP